MNEAHGPRPQGNYVPARRFGDLIFVSGMTPRENGELVATGSVAAGDPPEKHRKAIELATHNALRAARMQVSQGEALADVLSLTVYLNAAPDFTAHSRLADFASAVLLGEFGALPARAAVGVASLPGNAPVEISLIASVARTRGEA
ncbi:MAG TPA: RidA family protein [Devosiaceae bacterium]